MKKNLLFCLILCFCGLMRGQGSIDLLGKSDKLEIPFHYLQGFILIEVQFQFFLPLTFIFDTGAQNTIIFDKKLTDLFQTKYSKEISVLGADYAQEITALIARNMYLSTSKQTLAVERDIVVLKEDFVKMGEVVGRPIHGIAGANFFKGLIVEINYQKNKITLHNPNTYRYSKLKSFTNIPVEIVDHKPYILASIHTNTNYTDSLRLLMDTGAALSFMIQTESDSSLIIPQNAITGVLGKGLGGDIKGYIGLVNNVALHKDIQFENVIMYFQEVPDEEEKQKKLYRDGIMGNSTLERFHLIIDYTHNQVYLKPNKEFNKKFKYDRSGLTVLASGPRFNRFTVTHIINDSPADRSGLQVGDEIVKVGRIPRIFLSLDGITNKLCKDEGTIIPVTYRRKGAKSKAKIILKDWFQQ